MDMYEISAIDAYINRAFRIIIILPLTGATTSAFVFTFFKLAGWWPMVPVIPLVIYDIVNLFYLCFAIYLLKTSLDENGIIKPQRILLSKLYVGFLVFAQWNYITYLITDTEWWAYIFFFIALTIVFFDIKFTSIISFALIFSTIISWFINGEYHFLSLNDPLFWPTFILRLFCIGLSTATLLFITYFGGKYLVEELEKHINYDTLTHLLNRRTMNIYLNEALEDAHKNHSTFCLMMIDIDDFKHVNDTYGHECGDEVLQYVAHTISTGVKKDDYVFRWGGEEILVLLKTDIEKAKAAADRIRNDIAKDPIIYKNNISVYVTVTIGISSYTSSTSINQMMEDADQKLYQGKQKGKNQVVI